MDLLFKRYASPFLLIDNLITTKRFLEFVLEFVNIANDADIYDVWLHRVYDKNYPEFKEEVLRNSEIINVENQDIETTINESMNTLNNFKPT